MVLDHRHHWDEADQAFGEAVSLAQAMPYPYAEGRALHEYGMLNIHRGKSGQAKGLLEEALAIFRKLRAQQDIARTARELAMQD
jgi:Flp pilus assembly protein TadD